MEFSTPFHFQLASTKDGHGIYCGAQGAFIGAIPLLSHRRARDGKTWCVRAVEQLNDELSIAYSLPVDISRKAGGLETIAHALNENKVALAQIATLNLRLPDPPDLQKGVQSLDDAFKLVGILHWTGILKGDWDSDEHPRLGGPPNAGWFATKPKEPKPPKPGWPVPKVNRELRTLIKEFGPVVLRRGVPLLFGPAGVAWDFLDFFLDRYSPTELNRGEERLTQQYLASLDPPKTLDQLQVPPQETPLVTNNITSSNKIPITWPRTR